MTYPAWTVLHVPHDATEIPAAVRPQFVLSDAELQAELVRITDHHTLGLYSEPADRDLVVRADVSRLVVDTERFADDTREHMAARGLGAVYSVTSQLQPLRTALSPAERSSLLADYYHPHHARLEAKVAAALDSHGQALVLDCHSFPDRPLPYEGETSGNRPDICIGTDPFHTPPALAQALRQAFERVGWSVLFDDPFSGALVPQAYYERDRRVSSVMIEVNRALHLDEETGHRLPQFDRVAQTVRDCCCRGIRAAYEVT